MRTKIKQYIALLLLLILQIIGSCDLYAAIHYSETSIPPIENTHKNQHLHDSDDEQTAYYDCPQANFHKNISISLEDSDGLTDIPFSAKIFTAALAYCICLLRITEEQPITFRNTYALATPTAGRYLLFSNLRI